MSKSKSKGSYILTLPEYQRIFGTVYSILEGRANTPHACLYFASAGALILNKYYKIRAHAVGGLFMLCTDTDPSVLVFGEIVGGVLKSNSNGFHFWVETEHHIIDFMAPIYSEGAKNYGATKHIARKMFSKDIVSEVDSPKNLVLPGDYLTSPNQELTDELLQDFLDRQLNRDLLEACDQWFEKYPKKMRDMSLQDETGAIHKVEFKFPTIVGAW